MREEIKKLISESFNEALKSSNINEGSDGNYMIEQDLNVIENSLDSIRKHIDFESVPDWVENSIAKLAGEMTSLRNYYESGGHKKDDNLYDEEEYELEMGEEDEEDEEYDLEMEEESDEDEEYDLESEDEEDDEDIEEGIGRSHTMRRGMNAPRNK
jgi:hypothetical protein